MHYENHTRMLTRSKATCACFLNQSFQLQIHLRILIKMFKNYWQQRSVLKRNMFDSEQGHWCNLVNKVTMPLSSIKFREFLEYQVN